MISKKLFKRKNELQEFVYFVDDNNKVHRVYPVDIKPTGLKQYKKKLSEICYVSCVVLGNVLIAPSLNRLFAVQKMAEKYANKKEKERLETERLGKPDSV